MSSKPTTKATKTAPKTSTKAPTKPAPKTIRVTRDFQDRNGKIYKAGDVYKEISPERTAALMKAERTTLNTIGDIFLTEGE